MTTDRDTKSQRSESFVARLWLETGPGERPVWRGHVRHVQGREERYFQSLMEMQAFVEEVSGIAVPTVRSADPGGKHDNDGI